MSGSCIFCKIVQGLIPCHKVGETTRALAFMDVNPLSKGHVLVIPKDHAEFLHELSYEAAAEVGVLVAKVSRAVAGPDRTTQYNVLQNNGRLAHQEVPHVHFHVIPKFSEEDGLAVRWNTMPTDHDAFAKLAIELSERLEKL